MKKITKTVLQLKIDQLNFECGKKKGKVGEYVLMYDCAGVRLCRVSNSMRGVNKMSQAMTKREMGELLDTLRNVLYWETL